MTSRDRIVLLVVAAAVAVGGFWMLALKPKREEAADLGQRVAAAQQRLDTAEGELAASRAARSSYSANYATVARLGKAVPTDDDVPSLVYQLDTTANAAGVDFRSVKLTSGSGSGAAAQPQASQPQAQPPKAGQGASQQPGTQSTSTAAAPAPGAAAATQAATAGLPPGAVVGPAGLSTMPFSFSFEGSFFHLSDFLSRIERYISPGRRGVDVRGRLLLLNGISLRAAQAGFPEMKASISATAYLLPANQGLFNGATPNIPPTGSTQPVAGGSSPNPVTSAAPATVTAP